MDKWVFFSDITFQSSSSQPPVLELYMESSLSICAAKNGVGISLLQNEFFTFRRLCKAPLTPLFVISIANVFPYTFTRPIVTGICLNLRLHSPPVACSPVPTHAPTNVTGIFTFSHCRLIISSTRLLPTHTLTNVTGICLLKPSPSVIAVLSSLLLAYSPRSLHERRRFLSSFPPSIDVSALSLLLSRCPLEPRE